MCDGCKKEMDKDGIEAVYEQRLQGKQVWYCAGCNSHFYDFRKDINNMWERIDKDKFSEKEKLRVKHFVNTKKTDTISTIKKVVSQKVNAETNAKHDLAESVEFEEGGSKEITEDELKE